MYSKIQMTKATNDPSLADLNREAVDCTLKYIAIEVGSLKVRTPYYTNDSLLQLRTLLAANGATDDLQRKLAMGVKERITDFAWFRGKGTPEQIAQVVPDLLNRSGIVGTQMSAYGIEEVMKAHGLGVDCSGFVYNVLAATLRKFNLEDRFINSLQWKDDQHDVYHAGSFSFCGSASRVITPQSVRPLDLITITDGVEVLHVAIVVRSGDSLLVAQSSLVTNPSGVTLGLLVVGEVGVRFDLALSMGNQWEELLRRGRLAIRRLVCLESLT